METNTLPRNAMSHKHLLPVAVILVLCVLALYGNTLFNGFVYDDEYQILKNPWITDPAYLPEIFTNEAWGFSGEATSNYYRPLLHLVYMAVHAVFGYSAWAFHATNILLHAGVTFLVLLLAFRFLENYFGTSSLVPAFIAALFFAATPIHTEAVAPIMSVTEVAFTFFFLASLYVYLFIAPGWRNTCLSACLFFLASLFKETALTLPLVILAHDVIFSRGRLVFGRTVKNYTPFVVVTLIYLALRIHALGGFAPNDKHSDIGAWIALLNVFPLVSKYLLMLVAPVNLNALHDFKPHTSLFDVEVFTSIVVLAGFCALTIWTHRHNKLICFALFLIIIPLLPTLYIPAVPYPFAERYLYLPSVGFSLIVATVAAWALKSRRGALALYVTTFLVVGLYAYGTVKRNRIWKDNFTLWSDTVVKSPGNANVHYNLAVALKMRGNLEGAADHYARAVQLEPNAIYYRSLGDVYARRGLFIQSIAAYRQSLQLLPADARTYLNLGSTYAEMGDLSSAIEAFETAITLAPELADAHYNLGLAYRDRGNQAQAQHHFEEAVRLQSKEPAIRRPR